MSETRRFDSLERVVRDTRRLVDDTATTVLARLGSHTHPGGAGGTVADATTTAKGIVQLAGDLAGTAAAPTVPGLAGKAAAAHGHPYQPLDLDLTDIAALSPSDGTFLKRVTGAWNASTLAKSDVGLGSVDNTTDAAKPISDATQTALDAKAPLNLGSVSSYVGTAQTTTSTTYTDLATVGPTCTVTLSAVRRVLIWHRANCFQTSTTANRVFMSIVFSGATVGGGSDLFALIHNGSGQEESYGTVSYANLNAGTTTITAKYRVFGGTGRFTERIMVVIPV